MVSSHLAFITMQVSESQPGESQKEWLVHAQFFSFPEHAYNFSHYLNRFSMPYTSSPHWYSWDIAHVHFIR